jgi:hypothetical protein
MGCDGVFCDKPRAKTTGHPIHMIENSRFQGDAVNRETLFKSNFNYQKSSIVNKTESRNRSDPQWIFD